MNYGEFLAEALGGILISYKEHGSSQGDYVAIIEKDHDWHIYKGSYGSCTGCDWLKGTRIYSEEDYKKYDQDTYDREALEKCEILQSVKDEYLKENEPFLIIPKSQMPETLEDLKALLPANTRTIADENYNDLDLDAVIFEQMKNFRLNNLEYLEKKIEGKESYGE
jgi:hypothetical protein